MTMTSDDRMAPPGEAARFNLRDGQRPITFMGWKIAEANSQQGHDIRWTELTIYMTSSNKFVLEKVGRSDVMHLPGCKRIGRAKRYADLDEAFEDKGFDEEDGDLEDVFIACTICNPNFETAPVFVERDMFSVGSHETAEALVATLHRTDASDNSQFLSRVARSLLDDAAEKVPVIRDAYNAPTDIT